MVCAEDLFFVWRSGIVVHAKQSLNDQCPIKSLGSEALMTTLVGDISHMWLQLVAGGIKHALSTGRRPLAACAWSPLDFSPPPYAFSLCQC